CTTCTCGRSRAAFPRCPRTCWWRPPATATRRGARWRRCCTSASASITLRCRSITPAAGCSGSRHHGRSEMTKALYTAQAHVVGGRIDGHGRSSDGQLEVDLRLPSELGGKGDGTNPEELFAVGYAACFEGALTTVARRRKEEASDVAIDSRVK